MKSLRNFAIILVVCGVLSLLLTFFNERSLATFINLGSYVGAAVMLLGCWRGMSTPGPILEQLHMHQRAENYHAERIGRAAPHTELVPLVLSSGPLAFGGLAWLVALQAARYGFGITL